MQIGVLVLNIIIILKTILAVMDNIRMSGGGITRKILRSI